jgi:hypothetical protein
VFDNLPALSHFEAAPVVDELEAYLAAPIENVDITDIFVWWYEHRGTYPRLSAMALDYLSIPGKQYPST